MCNLRIFDKPYLNVHRHPAVAERVSSRWRWLAITGDETTALAKGYKLSVVLTHI